MPLKNHTGNGKNGRPQRPLYPLFIICRLFRLLGYVFSFSLLPAPILKHLAHPICTMSTEDLIDTFRDWYAVRHSQSYMLMCSLSRMRLGSR